MDCGDARELLAELRRTLAIALDRIGEPKQALELQLRGPGGSVIKTEDIGIRDMEFVLSIPDPEDDWKSGIDKPYDPAADAILAEDDGEDWLPDFDSGEPWDEEEPQHPRYQIQVLLIDHNAIP